ncbi:hypothetical protein FS837_000170 [Tulasnella sp. UAMH 9824]|nr:hypothetical protein FS837_000170 [Tulasnella sp. UAMH 9824]
MHRLHFSDHHKAFVGKPPLQLIIYRQLIQTPSPITLHLHSMDRNETHQIDYPSSRSIEPDHTKLRLSAKLLGKLEKLARWRIDPSLIRFPGNGPEFRGGNATVSRALLSLPSDVQRNGDKSENTTGERPISDDDDRNLEPHNDIREPRDKEKDADTSQDIQTDGVDSPRVNQDERKDSEGESAVQNPQPLKSKLALRESQFLLDLSHPNIIKIEGYVEDTSKHIIWLVFPWEENGNLRDFLASGEWEIPERISLINDVTEGVEYLHSQKPPIYHGDLKSLNVLVNSEYHALITDFGSARRLTDEASARWTKENQNKPQPEPYCTTDEEDTSHQLEAVFCATTNTITLTGSKYTLRWAAPELLSEDRPTLASDIWALGWIAYEVMTENIPFHDAKKDTIIVRRVIQGDLPSITEHARMSLARDLCSVMSQCWNDNPSQRPTSEECRKLLSWMPMMVPAPGQSADLEGSEIRYAQLLIKLGHMYFKQNDYGNASNCYSKALDYYRNTSNSEGRAKALYGLALVHKFQDKHSEAAELCSEALHIYTDLGARQAGNRARTLWALAEIHRLESDDEKAVEFFSESLRIYTELGDRPGRAYALRGLADIQLSRNQYGEASALYDEALEISTEIGDRIGRADCLWGIGEVHRAQLEYDKAIQVFSESIQISTDLGDRSGTAFHLSSLAEVYQLRGEYNKAIAFYTEALQICSEIDDRRGRASILWGLADTNYQQGHYNDAIPLYTDASETYHEIGDSFRAANVLEKAADSRKKLEESS